jgi:hypothetical protein
MEGVADAGGDTGIGEVGAGNGESGPGSGEDNADCALADERYKLMLIRGSL